VKHANAVDLVGLLGQRLQQEPTGWRDTKALLIVAGRESWNAAAAIADAMGVHPDDQELVYHQLRRETGPA